MVEPPEVVSVGIGRTIPAWDVEEATTGLAPEAACAALEAGMARQASESSVDFSMLTTIYASLKQRAEVHVEEAKDLFDVNVFGAVRVLQACLPSMRYSYC